MSAKRKFEMFIRVLYLIGLLTFTLSSIFRNSLTDFWKGFCEGSSVVAILLGCIYYVWCRTHKKNPFKYE